MTNVPFVPSHHLQNEKLLGWTQLLNDDMNDRWPWIQWKSINTKWSNGTIIVIYPTTPPPPTPSAQYRHESSMICHIWRERGSDVKGGGGDEWNLSSVTVIYTQCTQPDGTVYEPRVVERKLLWVGTLKVYWRCGHLFHISMRWPRKTLSVVTISPCLWGVVEKRFYLFLFQLLLTSWADEQYRLL